MNKVAQLIAHAAQTYAENLEKTIEGIDDVNRPLMRQCLMAAYLTGASQIAEWQCKCDGSPEVNPSKCLEAIEGAAIELLGHGSEPTRKG